MDPISYIPGVSYDTVVLANVINGTGVLGLILGHWLIARSDMQKGFILSSAGAAFVAAGSSLLLSWPVVFLNIAWLLLGIIGYKTSKTQSPETQSGRYDPVTAILLVSGFVVAHMWSGVFIGFTGAEHAAWVASAFYLISFGLLSLGLFQSRHYLFVCLLGYLLLVPHLAQTMNYAVLLNETIGALIGIWGILSYYRRKVVNYQSFTSIDK